MIMVAMFLWFMGTAGIALANCFLVFLQLDYLRRQIKVVYGDGGRDGDGANAEAARVGGELVLMGVSFVVLGVAQFWRAADLRDTREVPIWLLSFTSETSYLAAGMGFLGLGMVCAWKRHQRLGQGDRMVQD